MKRPKTPLTPEEERLLTVQIQQSVTHARDVLDGPLGQQLRETGQRLIASYQSVDDTITELEHFLLTSHPEKSASVALGPGLKLHYNDEGLSIEICEPGKYAVRPLREVGRNRKILALSKAPQLVEQLGE